MSIDINLVRLYILIIPIGSLSIEYWSPKILGEINESYVKVAKLKGEFLWHTHENEDEMFYVIKGILVIKFRDKNVILN